jgi:signal transduction histidine kinase/ActR/RegA family two-component response regulator
MMPALYDGGGFWHRIEGAANMDSMAGFIRDQQQGILDEWQESFTDLPAAGGVADPARFRACAALVLAALVEKIECSRRRRGESHSLAGPLERDEAAEQFAAECGPGLVHSAYRLLRAIVGRRWAEHPGSGGVQGVHELLCFDEVIDGSIAAALESLNHADRASAAKIAGDLLTSRGKPWGHEGEAAAALLDSETREPPSEETLRVLQKLRACEARFQTLVAATSFYVIYRMSADWSQLHEASGRGFLPDTTEPTGEWLEKYIYPDDRSLVLDSIREAINGKRAFDLEHRVIKADGSIGWAHSRAVPLLDNHGEIVEWFGAASDTTQRREAEEALREAGRRKDEFLAILAHELRNPLAPIRSAVEILKLLDSSDPTVARAQGMIDKQVAHMVRLIDDLLDVSRITLGKLQLRKQRVELVEVLKRAVEAARALDDARERDFQFELPAQPVYLDADPVRLTEVFSNLLNNACKFTDVGGRIRLGVELDHGGVVVSVADDGIGIPSESLGQVFEMFAQAVSGPEHAREGLGIGLSLARSLAEMHGGYIEAHSEGPGKGSTFRVWLPVDELESLQATDGIEGRRGKGVGCSHILLVDDSEAILDSLSVLLGLNGHDVRTARDGLEALAVAEQFGPDVVLLDLGMPRLDGYETCKRLREQPGGQELVIIALTGWGNDADRRTTEAAGFDGHLVKPVSLEQLTELVQQLQEHKGRVPRH